MVGRKGVKSEALRLQCEWSGCGAIFQELGEFYQHLEVHFHQDFSAVLNQNCELMCKWNQCSYITSDAQDILRHLYFHGYHTKVKWWGLLCHQKLSTKLGECKAHHNRNLIPELPDGFKCEWKDCDMVCDIPDQFYMHAAEHALTADPEKLPNGNTGMRCWWDDCTYSNACKFKLRDHLKTHTKERMFACPWCGNLYATKSKFSDHLIRQIEAQDHCFQCTHCLRTFASERLLKDHMRHHVNHYKCPKCEMTCPNPSAIKNHILYKHSDERPFACHFCEYRAKTSYDLNVHMTFHQSELAYKCHVEGCDYVVRSLQNLRCHFRMKHLAGRAQCYACHLCEKKFGRGNDLTQHLRNSHSFHWPPGHTRFKYKECDDNLFRLQTFRFESLELTEQLLVNDKAGPSENESTPAPYKAIRAGRRPKKSSLAEKRVTRSSATRMKKTKRASGSSSNQAPPEAASTSTSLSPNKSSPSPSKSSQPAAKRRRKNEPKQPPVSQVLQPHTEPSDQVEPQPPEPNQQQQQDDESYHVAPTGPESADNIPRLDSLASVPQSSGSTNDNLVFDSASLARYESGEEVRIEIDGQAFFLMKGPDDVTSQSEAYCLVSATERFKYIA